ncbi:hypothetical protein QX204_16775 [Nocardia sp. PE-7]|uniref:hypothetical protein n=1 Tax=Nocardia sp. PE-7 TaxID=3058426 RepID=UPI002658BAF3|nr:hypothetical protein [Nocardia sp. PE-7]WKG13031.1 hypothetical protein QX204_16775 [Nocardia sp. PE-7]
MLHSLESLYGQLAGRFAERVAHSDSATRELAFHNGVAVRLWVENDIVHAELDSLQGGPELWILLPGSDDIDEFVDAVADAVSC